MMLVLNDAIVLSSAPVIWCKACYVGATLISITVVTYCCNGLLFKGKIKQMTVQNASTYLTPTVCSMHLD